VVTAYRGPLDAEAAGRVIALFEGRRPPRSRGCRRGTLVPCSSVASWCQGLLSKVCSMRRRSAPSARHLGIH